LTFFVDANVLIYGAVDCEYRAGCLEVLEAIARGEAEGRTSTAVLEEVWRIERSGRAGAIDGLAERAYTILTPLLPVTDDAVRHALSLEVEGLGTNDRVHVGTCIAHGIELVLTADRGFDRTDAVQRVEPLDRDARQRLLGSM